jgi:AraC family transcriptional regulator
MQSQNAIQRQFGLSQTPAFLALQAPRSPVSVCRLRGGPMTTPSSPPPAENAYALHVMLAGLQRADQWFDGVYRELPSATQGGIFLLHFSLRASVKHAASFDVVRFGISQDALEEMAHGNGLNRVGDLNLQMTGRHDAVLHGLAQALVPTIQQPEQANALFIDHVAIAFFVHVTRTYGSRSTKELSRSRGLAPWQLRRAQDRMCADIDGDPSMANLADECGLSASQFARAFRQTTGTPPHQWLTRKRIERAKELLRTSNQGLADIAIACGFCDQSHLTRMFSQIERLPPGKWRRLHQI